MESKVYAIIPAAGTGRRMGGSILKQYIMLGDKPVLAHTLSAFDRAESVDCIVLAVSLDEREYIEKEIVKRYGIKKPVTYTPGGRERQESVKNALEAIEDCDIVVVHDGVRPLVVPGVIEGAIQEARRYGAAVAGMPVKDTIKVVSPAGFAVNTPDRTRLWQIQTPQAFQLRLLKEAHKRAAEDGFLGTDDSSLVERLGHPVKLIEGGYGNIKITTPEDVDLALYMMKLYDEKQGDHDMRIGMGYDVHRLVEGRQLIIGGVDIPYEKGLLGHSDADVLIHAIMDALLGAAALGDIGKHFPDTDERYRGISSMSLLEHVYKLLKDRNYRVVNIDATIIAQRPKMLPHIPGMRERIASVLELDEDRVNIKATTTEGLGFTGRGEGIAAQAVVLIE